MFLQDISHTTQGSKNELSLSILPGRAQELKHLEHTYDG